MNKILLNFIVVPVFVTVWGCSQENAPVMVGSKPLIENISAADKWNPRQQQKYKIEISVVDPQGPDDIQSVVMEVRRDETGPVIHTDSLFDDGAYYNTEDGDIFAGDGIFSNRFLPREISSPIKSGLYYFQFRATDFDGNEDISADLIISISDNRAPEITGISAPDTFSVFSAAGIIQVAVNDSDGIADITRVYFESQKPGFTQIRYESELYDDGNLLNGDLIAGDSVFSAKLDTSFLVGKKGTYNLLFHVADSFDEVNQIIPQHMISVSNYKPLISSISVPDTMIIPSSGLYDHESILVSVQDPEGLADIDSVYFFSFRDSNPLFDGLPLFLQDNGVPFNYQNYIQEISETRRVTSSGDKTAGDGIYTFPLVIESNFTPGSYLFRFYASDKAGNIYGPVDKILEVER